MIYLITGVPGSGKTLYAVSTLLKSLAAQRPTRQGVEIERRVCVDNIKDLLIPHEMLCPMVLNDRDELVKEDENGHGVWNWPDWCKPGDVIVIDEVQRHWRPRGMGAKPPREIQALETHRHLGIDFVIITQNPMLIDQNVRRLIGRHQHVRRLFGMQRAVIYDWDGCSVDPTRTKSATTSFFNYPKSAYDLYKSSELHTKQKQKVPLWIVVPIVAIIGGILVAPMAFATLRGAMTGKGVSQPQQPASAPKPSGSSVNIGPPVLAPLPPASAPTAQQMPFAGAYVPPAPKTTVLGSLVPGAEATENAGCIVVRDRCGCYTPKGQRVTVALELCVPAAGVSDVPKAIVQPDAVPVVLTAAADADAFAHMRRAARVR
ncbi:MAG: zonular occludens toxin domain-containing protein [Pseudomonadota bacterium]